MAFASILGFLLLLMLVLLPLAAGIALIVSSRRGGLGYPACGSCQYNLSASVGKVDRCPECGAMFQEAGILPPRGKRKPLLLWAGIALIAIPLICGGIFIIPAMVFSQQGLARARAQAAAQAAAAQAAAQQQAAQQQTDVTEPNDNVPQETQNDEVPPENVESAAEGIDEEGSQ